VFQGLQSYYTGAINESLNGLKFRAVVVGLQTLFQTSVFRPLISVFLKKITKQGNTGTKKARSLIFVAWR